MKKLIEQEIIIDEPLPGSVSWDILVDRPTSLKDISTTDATTLDTASSTASSAQTSANNAQTTANGATIDAGNAQTTANGAQTTASNAQISADTANGGLTDIAIQGWTFDGVFSAVDNETVTWTAGTLRFKDGTTFSINSSTTSTSGITVLIYIYFDKAYSTVNLNTGPTASNSVGQNKVLIAVMQAVTDTTKKATFQVFGGGGGVGTFVGGQNIAQSSISSSHIVAGTILATNIAANTITGNNIAVNSITGNNIAVGSVNANKIVTGTITATQIAAGAITSSKINVGSLSAISANIGTITAGSITGITITGGTIQTAISGQRIVIDGSGNQIECYDSNGYLGGAIFSFNSSIWIETATFSYVDMSAVQRLIFSGGTATFQADILPSSNNSSLLGTSGRGWSEIWGNQMNITTVSGIAQVALFIVNNGTSNALDIQHTGGYPGIYMNNTGTNDDFYSVSGAYLTKGGVWTNASSKEIKENFKSTKTLDKIIKLNVLEYNYISENKKATKLKKRRKTKKDTGHTRSTISKLQKHMTPMAEDFYKAFGLGDNKSISPADIAGVALQAIKELNTKVDMLAKLVGKKSLQKSIK